MNTVQAFKKAKFAALLLLCFSAFIYAFGRSISKLTSGETSVEMEFQRWLFAENNYNVFKLCFLKHEGGYVSSAHNLPSLQRSLQG